MAEIKRKLLPSQLKPVSYHLRVEPDLRSSTFQGHVEIVCESVESTNEIQLHCSRIDISNVVLGSADNHVTILLPIVYNADEEIAILRLSESVPAGKRITVIMDYEGHFKPNLAGLYQSSYIAEDGTENYLAVTQMEPTYARRVFPCFDEPQLKAEFIISAIVKPSDSCLSNMPVESSTTISESKVLITFQKTPRMSTYLVGLVVGPLGHVKSSKSRIPIAIYCPLGAEDEANFALDIAVRGVELYERLFDSLYPLPKLDLVGVPDFSSGAMENWGLIISRTAFLLVDPEESGLEKRKLVAEIVLHEISHQWFGNLVTMKYWDGLWLKEGFATCMSWIAADKFFPEWHVWEDYVSETLQVALALDSLESSHPVELVIQDPSEVNQIFDDISYEKGSCLVRMIEHEVGEASFMRGIREYIRRHKYGNTESHDLWSALEYVCGEKIGSKMDIWTKRVGFPVVTVEEKIDHSMDGKSKIVSYCLRQERFLASGTGIEPLHDQLYPLRIVVRSDSGVETVDMHERELVIRATGSGLFKVNANHDGFYRTAYSANHLQRLIDAANHGLLSLRDCVGLIADVSALVTAGKQRTSSLLNLCFGLRHSNQYLVWKQISKSLESICKSWNFQPESTTRALKQVSVTVLGPKAHEIGWEISDNDDEIMEQFKPLLFAAAGNAGDPVIIKAAQAMFDAYLTGDKEALSPSLRYEVFGIVAGHGGEKEIKELYKIFKTSSNEDDKNFALECLGRAPTPKLLRYVLEFALTKDVKDQDLHLILWLMNTTAHGSVEAWEWAKKNWDELEVILPADLQCKILSVVLDGFSTATQMSDISTFFANRDTKSFDKIISQELEKIDIRRQWVERDTRDVSEWLASKEFLENSENDAGTQVVA